MWKDRMMIIIGILLVLSAIGLMFLQAVCNAKLHEHIPDTFYYPSGFGSKVAMCKEDNDNG